MAGIGFYSRANLQANVSKLSDKVLREYEVYITTRMGNIHKFCPWPALEESLAQDIAAVWREQKFRAAAKERVKSGSL